MVFGTTIIKVIRVRCFFSSKARNRQVTGDHVWQDDRYNTLRQLLQLTFFLLGVSYSLNLIFFSNYKLLAFLDAAYLEHPERFGSEGVVKIHFTH